MERTATKSVRLYVVEEQEIYRDIYKSVATSEVPIELLQVSGNGNGKFFKPAVAEFSPDVVLISAKKLEMYIIEELERIREDYPKTGVVLLLGFCNPHDIELLRELAVKSEGGMALFLKQSLDQIDQLCRTILAVSQGQVILDPLLATFMFAGKPECPFLKQLTARELEILSLLSQGYTNAAIAGALFIDIKTVEHHLNSTYSKLKADPGYNNRHLRVSAAKLYLETMGDLYQKEDLQVHAGAIK